MNDVKNTDLTFTSEELLHYAHLRAEADEYLNQLIRKKRVEQFYGK